MSTKSLKAAAVLLPLLFWVIVLRLRSWLLQYQQSWQIELFILLILTVGTVLFTSVIFRVIENREAEIEQRSEQLAALHQAAVALTTELDLGTVLQKVADLAVELVGARYGALAVFDVHNRVIDQFITCGISPEERAHIGKPPEGIGLLGALLNNGHPIRISRISEDPRAVGFPPSHPYMESLLGVPIVSKGKTIGALYLTDKMPQGSRSSQKRIPFTEQDEQLLVMFATQAAIAIENAQLYRQTQQLAVLQERERFGMDLHDGVIQSIYAIGLMLDDTQHQLAEKNIQEKERIKQALNGLNEVIRDIRNYILDLRPERFQGRDLHRGLKELDRDLRANSLLSTHLNLDGIKPNILRPEQTVEVLHIAQEALTNIRKHARARNVYVSVARKKGLFILSIADDGIGVQNDQMRVGGHGLVNMQLRAESLGGSLKIAPRDGGGTCVTLYVPINEE